MALTVPAKSKMHAELSIEQCITESLREANSREHAVINFCFRMRILTEAEACALLAYLEAGGRSGALVALMASFEEYLARASLREETKRLALSTIDSRVRSGILTEDDASALRVRIEAGERMLPHELTSDTPEGRECAAFQRRHRATAKAAIESVTTGRLRRLEESEAESIISLIERRERVWERAVYRRSVLPRRTPISSGRPRARRTRGKRRARAPSRSTDGDPEHPVAASLIGVAA
jgi:hypothetical protein